MTTGIEKSPDDPCEFQLQPNEEIKKHAPRQVPINPQGALHQETEIHQGNQFIAEPVEEVTECVSSLEIVDERVPADFNTGKDHSPWETTRRPDGFLDGFSNGFQIVDEVPSDLNIKEKVKDHLQDHLQDTNGPFPGLTMAYDGYQPNFKSPTSLQTDMSKEGLEALQHSTLVMFELKTSTASEKTCQNLEMRKLPMLKPLDHYILIGWTCDWRQLPQDQDLYWNFKESLSDEEDIEDEGSRPVTSKCSAKSSTVREFGCPVLRSNKDPSYSYSYSSRKQFMKFYSTLHSSCDVPYQERGSPAERTLCKVPSMPNVPSVLKHWAMCIHFRHKFSGDGGRSFILNSMCNVSTVKPVRDDTDGEIWWKVFEMLWGVFILNSVQMFPAMKPVRYDGVQWKMCFILFWTVCVCFNCKGNGVWWKMCSFLAVFECFQLQNTVEHGGKTFQTLISSFSGYFVSYS